MDFTASDTCPAERTACEAAGLQFRRTGEERTSFIFTEAPRSSVRIVVSSEPLGLHVGSVVPLFARDGPSFTVGFQGTFRRSGAGEWVVLYVLVVSSNPVFHLDVQPPAALVESETGSNPRALYATDFDAIASGFASAGRGVGIEAGAGYVSVLRGERGVIGVFAPDVAESSVVLDAAVMRGDETVCSSLIAIALVELGDSWCHLHVGPGDTRVSMTAHASGIVGIDIPVLVWADGRPLT